MINRWKIGLTIAIIILSFVVLFTFYGYESTWRLWNIPVLSPSFADLRAITHGSEAVAQGFDPMLNNPGDPWGRPLNYPRIWQALYWFGLNSSHTVGLGIFSITCFLSGIILIFPNINSLTLGLLIPTLLSPAVLLGVERGNIDLIIFLVVAIAIYVTRSSTIFGDFSLLLGIILKIFPLFGISLLFRLPPRQFLRHFSGVIAVTAAYFVVSWSDFKLISQTTQRSPVWSYGVSVMRGGLGSIDRSLGLLSILVSGLLLLTALFLAYLACTQDSIPQFTEQHGSLNLDAFRVGCSIYLGTFLMGSNWDYRLLFLILTLPQLAIWLTIAQRQLRWSTQAAVLMLLLSLWHFKIVRLWGGATSAVLPTILGVDFVPWFLDEVANWSLFLVLTYLIARSLPPWAKSWVLAPWHQVHRLKK